MEQIFLDRYKNIKSVDHENKMNINLTQKVRLLPYSNVSDTLNLNEQFNTERDNANRYRLIFTVNPICSNVLHNMKTEIVYREGSPDCNPVIEGLSTINSAVLGPMVTNTKTPVDYIQAIRDTEYSHPNMGPLVYHCGLDIFNNHMLRSDGFNHISRMNKGTTAECGSVFNTIFDYQRDSSGNIVKEVLPRANNSMEETKVHQYQVDNILTFDEAVTKHMKEKDGWFGFDNVGFIDIPNATDGTVPVNRVMNNNKACEFIDMYPDRSLFSFVPKVNKYRKRTERNWDYCITYPFMSDVDKFNEIMGCGTKNAIMANIITGKTANGHELVVFKTMIKHNLHYGDCIRLFHGSSQKDIYISGIGDESGNDEEHCFKIYLNEIPEVDLSQAHVFVKKLSNSSGCKYYFRKFKKLKAEDNSELDSTIAKLAYGENIYGDRLAEIIYTDDIVTAGLRDNLGRPLSEIYLTIVKTNRGHNLWYDENKFNDARIEYSHCFGDVTSGIDIPAEFTDYNVRKLHNIRVNAITDTYSDGLHAIFGDMFDTNPKPIEKNITVDKFDEFYGDIVEFDQSTNQETVIEHVYHRFNTAQRETLNPHYFDLHYDVLAGDDYDVGTMFNDVENTSGFTVWTGLDTMWVGDGEVSSDDPNLIETYVNHVGNKLFPGNLQPEGYFYQPHYRIKIREISDRPKTQVGAQIAIDLSDTAVTEPNSYISVVDGVQTYYVEFTTKDLYNYVIGDLFGVYKGEDGTLIWGILDSFTPNTEAGKLVSYTLRIETSQHVELRDLTASKWEFVLTDGSMPMYASYIQKEQRFVWRDILSPSEVSPENPLSEMMFTNGANYIHTNINFFLKRQDPFAEYGLFEPKSSNNLTPNPLKKYKKFGVVIDITKLIYLGIQAKNACL